MLKNLTLIAALATLIGCGGSDDDNGAVPDAQLTGSAWTVTEARSGEGELIQPITRLIDEGKPAIVTFEHGWYRISYGVNQDDDVTDKQCKLLLGGYEYLGEVLAYRNKSYDATSIRCSEEHYAMGGRFVELFSPGARWAITEADEPALTLTDTDGTTYRLTGAPH